jgi:hypothetical protein
MAIMVSDSLTDTGSARGASNFRLSGSSCDAEAEADVTPAEMQNQFGVLVFPPTQPERDRALPSHNKQRDFLIGH